MQGAAWLQAQATSAAAATAAALSCSSSSSHDSAAPPFAAAPSPSPWAAGQPQPTPASMHRRHTSTASLSVHERAVSSSANARALSPAGQSAAALNTPYTLASKAVAMTPATCTDTDGTSSSTVSNSAASPLTAQESLDRAAAALQALQQKFTHPRADNDSTQQQLSSPGVVKLALKSSQSSFDFKSAVAGLTSAVDPASLPQPREHLRQAHRTQHSDDIFTESAMTSASGQVSSAAVSSKSTAPTISQGASAAAAQAASAEQEGCSTGSAMPGYSFQARESPSEAMSLHADDFNQHPCTSSNQVDAQDRLSIDSRPDSDAGGQQSHGVGSQFDDSGSFQAKQSTPSRCEEVQGNEEVAQEADTYNLHSLEPISPQRAMVSPATVWNLT